MVFATPSSNVQHVHLSTCQLVNLSASQPVQIHEKKHRWPLALRANHRLLPRRSHRQYRSPLWHWPGRRRRPGLRSIAATRAPRVSRRRSTGGEPSTFATRSPGNASCERVRRPVLGRRPPVTVLVVSNPSTSGGGAQLMVGSADQMEQFRDGADGAALWSPRGTRLPLAAVEH